MDIEIKGKVTQVLEEQSGTSQKGPWRKQDFILETEDKYPKPVCITQWGDDIDAFDVQVGDRLTAHVDIQSREYNGRWYTDVKAWRVTKETEGAADAPPPVDDEPWPDAAPDDDLPF